MTNRLLPAKRCPASRSSRKSQRACTPGRSALTPSAQSRLASSRCSTDRRVESPSARCTDGSVRTKRAASPVSSPGVRTSKKQEAVADPARGVRRVPRPRETTQSSGREIVTSTRLEPPWSSVIGARRRQPPAPLVQRRRRHTDAGRVVGDAQAAAGLSGKGGRIPVRQVLPPASLRSIPRMPPTRRSQAPNPSGPGADFGRLRCTRHAPYRRFGARMTPTSKHP